MLILCLKPLQFGARDQDCVLAERMGYGWCQDNATEIRKWSEVLEKFDG